MTEDAHNRKHDRTLARDVLLKIRSAEDFSLLCEYYQLQTQDLSSKLEKMDASTSANKIDLLFSLLQGYQTDCGYYSLVPLDKKQKISSSFQALLKELSNLEQNSRFHGITLTCALDGFTLNSTTYLIENLEKYMQNKQQSFQKETLKPSSLKPEGGTGVGFLSQKSVNKLELTAVRKLHDFCSELRTQIGSPETRPKGLVIYFMFHLCKVISSVGQIYPNHHSSDFFKLIKREAEKLRELYPDLAAAGEQLQEAVANCQPQRI